MLLFWIGTEYDIALCKTTFSWEIGLSPSVIIQPSGWRRSPCIVREKWKHGRALVFWEILIDGNKVWVEDSANPTKMNVPLCDLVWKRSIVKFAHNWSQSISNILTICKILCLALSIFLRRQILWGCVSLPVHMPMNHELLKAFSVRWCPDTNTIHTCHGELGIFMSDVFLISGLLISSEMYDGCFPGTACYEQEALPFF